MQFVDLANTIALLEMIPVILVMLLSLWGVVKSTGRNRNLALLTLLISLCFLATVLVVTSFRMGLITLTDWTGWGIYIDFGMRGIIYFLILVYVIIWAYPDFFSERKWALIVVLIGPILFEILMYLNFGVTNIYASAFWVTLIALALLYMVLIPLLAVIRRTGKEDLRGSPVVKWLWLVFIGVLIWFLGEAVLGIGQLLHLPSYTSISGELAVTTVSAHTIGWYFIFVGYFLQGRTSQSGA